MASSPRLSLPKEVDAGVEEQNTGEVEQRVNEEKVEDASSFDAEDWIKHNQISITIPVATSV